MKKLYVLGLPGSGKSTVARYIVENMKQQGFWSERVNDYTLLKRRFDEQNRTSEKSPGRFYPVEQGGFYIVDRTVCDEVLYELDETIETRSAQSSLSLPESEGVMVIEFARSNYLDAFKQFQNVLPEDTYLLFLNAKLSVCRNRILIRTTHPKTEDDYFVSDYTFEFYYGKDNEEYLQTECDLLAGQFGLSRYHMKIISTEGVWKDVEEKVSVWLAKTFYRDLHRKLPDTGPLERPPVEVHVPEDDVRESLEVSFVF